MAKLIEPAICTFDPIPIKGELVLGRGQLSHPVIEFEIDEEIPFYHWGEGQRKRDFCFDDVNYIGTFTMPQWKIDGFERRYRCSVDYLVTSFDNSPSES